MNLLALKIVVGLIACVLVGFFFLRYRAIRRLRWMKIQLKMKVNRDDILENFHTANDLSEWYIISPQDFGYRSQEEFEAATMQALMDYVTDLEIHYDRHLEKYNNNDSSHAVSLVLLERSLKEELEHLNVQKAQLRRFEEYILDNAWANFLVGPAGPQQ